MTDLHQLELRLPALDHREQVPMWAIHAVVQFIAQKFDPERIILFGSHAYGRPNEASDVDLLVVMETALTPRQQRMEIYRSLRNRPFGIDLIVRTPRDLEWRISQGDYFLEEVVQKGKILYERPHP